MSTYRERRFIDLVNLLLNINIDSNNITLIWKQLSESLYTANLRSSMLSDNMLCEEFIEKQEEIKHIIRDSLEKVILMYVSNNKVNIGEITKKDYISISPREPSRYYTATFTRDAKNGSSFIDNFKIDYYEKLLRGGIRLEKIRICENCMTFYMLPQNQKHHFCSKACRTADKLKQKELRKLNNGSRI